MRNLFLVFISFLVSLTAQEAESFTRFDLMKMQQIYDNYTIRKNVGATLVMGHPFHDRSFCEWIADEQKSLQEQLRQEGLDDLIALYDPYYQVHATLVQLAAQNQASSIHQKVLSEDDLLVSAHTQKPMNINYVIDWVQQRTPFEVELGPDVLSHAHRDHAFRITEGGQIVMKGRAKQRTLLAEIRAEFEKEAGIVHKYGKEDDEFFFVIGYLKPDTRLLDLKIQERLHQYCKARAQNLRKTILIDRVSVLVYDDYSLSRSSILWESPQFVFQKEIHLPEKTLLETLKKVDDRGYESVFDEAI